MAVTVVRDEWPNATGHVSVISIPVLVGFAVAVAASRCATTGRTVVDPATARLCPVDVIVCEQKRRLHCVRHGNSAFIYGAGLEDPRHAGDLCGLDGLQRLDRYASEALKVSMSPSICRPDFVMKLSMNSSCSHHVFEIAPRVP